MKKFKIVLFTILVTMMTSLIACENTEGTSGIGQGYVIKDNNLLIHIKNSSTINFEALQISLQKHALSSAHADGTKISQGEITTFEFLEKDELVEGNNEVEVFALKQNKEGKVNHYKTLGIVKLDLERNTEYFLEIKGSEKSNLRVEKSTSFRNKSN